jgi:chromosome segregation ATPase
MPDIIDLIGSLKDSLNQTKAALDHLSTRKTELQKQENPSVEESERLDVEIMVLKQHVSETEQAISSLSKMNGKGEINGFRLGSEQK